MNELTLSNHNNAPWVLSESVSQQKLAVLLPYRGHWCPFCRANLKDIQSKIARFNVLGARVFPVTADAQDKIAKTRSRLGLEMTVLSDPQLQLEQQYQVQVSRKHPESKKYPAGGFLQPALLIFDSNGTLVYEWRQQSKMTNLFGAAGRPSADDILDILQSL